VQKEANLYLLIYPNIVYQYVLKIVTFCTSLWRFASSQDKECDANFAFFFCSFLVFFLSWPTFTICKIWNCEI